MPNLLPNTLEVQIVRMVKALYDAAPGYTYLTALKGLTTVDAVSQTLNANFSSLTNAQWAALISSNLHLTGGAATAAQNYLIAQINAGFTRAQVLPAAMSGLASLESDATFGAAALYFNNSIATSYAYSINPANTSTDIGGVLRLADEPNSAPVAVNDTGSATEGGAVVGGTVASNDSDAEGNTLTYSLAAGQNPVPGLLFNSNGSYTFDPRDVAYDSIRAGNTQVVTVNYRVSDGTSSAGATLSITVTGTNDGPVAAAVTATGNEDTTFAVTPASTDVDAGDTVTYSVVSNPSRGTVVFNAATGRFDYTPSADFNGTDSFTYRATDAGGLSSAPVTATVNVVATNDAPVAVAGQPFSGPENSNITGTVTATDIDGDSLTYSVPAANTAGAPANGTVSINAATGAFVYTPKAGFVGSDTFTFTANDGKGGVSAPGTVTVNVTDLPDILTTGIDTITLSGNVGQTVLGNELTYNSGDSIVGSSAIDTLRLQLNPANNGTTTLSSARVTGIEIFQISSNPNNPNSSTVDLLMTNVSTDLSSIEINKSTVQDLQIRDIQSTGGSTLPVVKINDVGANVEIDYDDQDVAGAADLQKVELNEFGSTSSSNYGRADLSIDSAVETVQITDKAASTGFASDMNAIWGGFSNLNILGGAAGVPLTFAANGGGGWGGFLAGSTLTVDSTVFAGNLVADVDGADTVLAGVGNDSLFANDDVAGLMSMGAGNDSFSGEDSLQGTVLGGDGNDAISFGGWMNDTATSSNDGTSLIDGGAGNDSISVGGTVNALGTIAGGTGNDTVSVGGNLAGAVTGNDGNDTITVFSGITTGGLVDGGAGNDTIATFGLVTGSALGGSGDDTITSNGTLGDNAIVTAPAARGLLDGGDGNDTISQTGTVSEGAIINGGAGDDTITVAGNIEGNLVDNLTPAVNDYQVAAAVNGGDGNDTLTITSGLFNGKVNMGAGNDTVTIRTGVTDGTGAVDLGDGDDSITLQNRSWTAATTDGALGNDDAILGGAGSDAMTVQSTSTVSTVARVTTLTYTTSLNGTIRATFNDGANATQPAPVVVTVNNAASVTATVTALAVKLNDTPIVFAYWTASVNTGGQLVLTSKSNGASAPLVSFTNGEVIAESGAIVSTIGGSTVAGGVGGAVGPWSVTTDGTGTTVTGDVNDGTDITGVESLNLNATDGYVGDEVGNTAGVQDLKYDHTFNIALEAYDTALAAINVLERDNSATVNLSGYNSEQINVDADGNQNTAANPAVVVNVNDTQGTSARALNVALNGAAAYTVAINDDLRISTTNLAVNGTGNRSVTLDGGDQDNNDTVAGEGNSLVITGNNTGVLTITGIYQETVDGAAYNGNQLLTIVDDADGGNETLTITTGAGNDVINMVADMLNYSINVGTGAVSGDSINGGAGTDRLIIDNSTTTSGNSIDQDFVFKRITSIEELEARGNAGGTLNISIENDANLTGIRKVIASNNAGTRGNINLNFESDFAIGGVPPAVVVDVESSNIVIDNGANSNLTVNIQAAKASAGGTASGAYVGFIAASGTGAGVVDVNVIINGTGATNVGGVGPAGGYQVNQGPGAGSIGLNSANAGQVILETLIGTIDSLTLTDNGTTDNAVNVTWNDAWADAVGAFPVSFALANNDATTPDTAGLATGGVNFVGAAENDSGFNVTGSANNDTIWGGQLGDVINAGAGNDFVNADPAVGMVVAPGTQMQKQLGFNTTQVIEAGDRVSVTIGGRTYTWTAPADAANLAASGALPALVSAINSSGSTANVTETGNIDDGNNEDDVAAAMGGTDFILLNGIGVDTTFGYALGENHGFSTSLTAVTMNRPTAVVDLAGVGSLDTGDVVTINVNGTLYSATVGAASGFGGINGILDSNAELAAALASAVNSGVLMAAEANGTQVILRGNTASTSYTVTPSWTTDQLTTPATSKTAVITYSAIGGGESVSATFAGGITVSSTTVAGLAAAINGNGTLAPQWNASAVGNVLTLAADVAGDDSPTTTTPNAFVSASFNGSGTASWSTSAGTDAVTRTDNTDPTIAARTATFTFSDGSYDAGDVIAVTINGVTTNVTLGNGGSDTANDVNLTGTQVATQVSATVAAAGVTDVAVGNEVRFDAGTSTATFLVTTTNSTRTGALAGTTAGDIAEVIDVDYTAAVAATATSFTITVNGTTVGPAGSLAALAAAFNALSGAGLLSNGTNGLDASVIGNTIRLTGVSTGLEPMGGAEPTDPTVSGAGFSDGGAVITTVNDPADAAIRHVIDVEYTGAIAGTDGADITIEGVVYSVNSAGSVNATLTALRNAVNAATGTHGWTASVNAGDLRLTGPADGSNPDTSTGTITAANIRDDDGTGTVGAATAADDTNGEVYTATLALTSGTPTSISVTFDSNDNDTVDVLDSTLTGTNTGTLAALINSTYGIGGTAGNTATTDATYLSAVAVNATTLTITGMSLGTGSTNQPLLVTFGGATGTANVTQTAPGDATSNPFTQIYTVTGLNAGDTVIIRFGDSSSVSVPFNTDAATTLVDIGAAIEAKLFPSSVGVVSDPAGADNVEVTGPNATTNPATTVSSFFVYQTVNVLPTTLITTGVGADAANVTLDFSAWGAGETGTVTFANGETFSAPWNTNLATSLIGLAAAIAADTIANGDVNGLLSWPTITTTATELLLEGPLGTAPDIDFISAAVIANTAAVPTEVQESWDNTVNTNPTVTVTSGAANIAPTANTNIFAVGAATSGANGSDSVNGGDGNDTINGLGGNDTLNGDAGNDVIDGGDGNDQIAGGDGHDSLTAGSGNDVVTGGAGNDTVDGAAGNDNIDGGDGADRLVGADGNDTITGGAGDDLIRGGGGRDLLTGGDGTDVFYFSAIGTLSESQGAVSFADVVNDFTSGVDKFQFDFNVNFYANVTNATNLLAGLTDVSVAAGPAAGRAIYDSSAKMLFVDVNGDGAITLSDDIVIDLTQTSVSGLSLSDFINAGVPTGTAGNDLLIGTGGADTMTGLDGNDTMFGGTGVDNLTGGNGADVFHFASTGDSTNTITDFVSGTDKLQFTATTVAYSGAVATLGTSLSTAPAAGKAVLVVTTVSSVTTGVLNIDVDGNGTSDIQLTLNGVATLSQGDFLAPTPAPGI